MEQQEVSAMQGATSGSQETDVEETLVEYTTEHGVSVTIVEDPDQENELDQEEDEEDEEGVVLESLPVQFQKVGRLGCCHCTCYF